MKEQVIYSLDEVSAVAERVKAYIQGCKVVTLTGSLGAGKTTLMHALMAQYGVQEQVTSPTFTYVNRYTNKENDLFYHFDLYRLSSADDLYAFGFDEYLHEPHAKLFIEWPSIALMLLQTVPTCHITIDYHGLDKRILTITKEDAHE